MIGWIVSSGMFGRIEGELFKLSRTFKNLPQSSIVFISITIVGLFLLIRWSINKICNTIHSNRKSDNLKEIITAISDKPNGVGYNVEFEITQNRISHLKVTREDIKNKKEQR